MGLLAYFTYPLLSRAERNFSALQVAHMELKASEAHAHHLAFHDVLTGLPNRAMFNTCVDHALVRARNGESLAILLLDLDRFKHVNDTWGHLAGDVLIREIAIRLSGVMGPDDTVARLGGDEFAILAADGTEEGVASLAERILQAARRPFDVLGNRVFVGLSIGVAITPQSGTERAELLRKADIALYRVKGEGRNGYRVFSDEMDETVKVRAAIENDLREALANGQELEVYYQPQIDSETHELAGVEALTRWKHPVRGFVPPSLFVPIAEDTGLINQLDEWVLGEACRAARQWPTLSIAVNLSPVQFRTNGFAERITRLVKEAGVDPQQIELEITEGVLVDDDDHVRESLENLRAAGFRIALDDFGTGYSSLSYLRKFEVDKIKIDRSFVQSIGEGDATSIVTAVVTLGHAMGLSVTAEGVETAEQRDFLKNAGCNEFQGYLFSKALPEKEITQMLYETEAEPAS
jgi:diguanylate cyclase (GGDEF)-like protein